jgi:hypothetical protein
MPGTPEFEKLCDQLQLPPMSYCVAASVLKPWRADVKAFLARREGLANKKAKTLFYKPSSNVDIHGEEEGKGLAS